MVATYVIWLDELGQKDSTIVGKKCANLGEMRKLDLRVPEGFAITVDAYNDFLVKTGASKEVQQALERYTPEMGSIDGLNRLSAELRKIVESKEMPREIRDVIASCYRELCQRCGVTDVPVSTRSAGPVSRPGQYETYLNVKGEEGVIEKTKRVWGSTFNARSLAFRSQKGLPLEKEPIGVAVLRMVRARAAGVLFTVDPNTGDPSTMVIEANWGLGESVVSGKGMPDVYVVDKESLNIVKRQLGQKERYVAMQEVAVTEEETPPEKRRQFCLTDEEVREICRMGKVLEEHFGVPQDVEWAVDEGLAFPDSVVLLQTRAAVIATRKSPVDQVVDWFMSRL